MPSERSPFTLRAALRRQRVLVLALVALLVVIAVGVMGDVPMAGVMLIVLLVLLAILRAVLPTQAVGALAVRPRWIDVSIMLTLALGLALVVGVANL